MADGYKDKAVRTIKTKCTDKVSRIANITCIILLAVWAVLRFLWCFGVFEAGTTVVVNADVVAPTPPPAENVTPAPAPVPVPPPTNGTRLLLEQHGRALQATAKASGFANFCFFMETLYFIAFIAILALIEFKKDNKFSVLARTYFNFLNTILGRGVYLIFMAMILVEKHDQFEIGIAIYIIVVAICDIVLGWDEDPQPIPHADFSEFNPAAPARTQTAAKF